MAPPNNPLVAKGTLVFKRDQRTFVNTMHFKRASAWGSGDLVDLANALVNWWLTYYNDCASNTISLVQVQTRKLDPSNPLGYDLNVTNAPGALTSDPEPANVTSTISWRTGLAGRKYRGRIYVPGFTVAESTPDDRITSGLVTLLVNAAQHMLTDMLPTGTSPVVFHALTNTFTDITTFVIENIIDSQRRRLPARGR